MTSVVKTMDTLQLRSVLSGGPPAGSKTLASQQESDSDHADCMLRAQAFKVKSKMKEERAQFLEQQTFRNSQVNDFVTALQEMEQLLEEM